MQPLLSIVAHRTAFRPPQPKTADFRKKLAAFPCFPNVLRVLFQGGDGLTQTVTHTGVKLSAGSE